MILQGPEEWIISVLLLIPPLCPQNTSVSLLLPCIAMLAHFSHSSILKNAFFKPGTIPLCMGSIPSGFASGTNVTPKNRFPAKIVTSNSFQIPQHRTLDSAYSILGDMGGKNC